MSLRILSYNILSGGEERLPLIANIIQQQRPDVVALLEANSRSNVEALAQQLNMELAFGEANSKFHVAWLSRLPLLDVKNHRLPILAKTLLEINLSWEGIPLALFATHLRAGRYQEHDELRAQEMQSILSLLRLLDNQPHMLVGDLNTVHPTDRPNTLPYVVQETEGGEEEHKEVDFPRKVIPLLLNAGYTDCYHSLHPTASGYTYPAPVPTLRLDYIFASSMLAKRLRACNIVTGGEAEKASDHFPIWAEFK